MLSLVGGEDDQDDFTVHAFAYSLFALRSFVRVHSAAAYSKLSDLQCASQTRLLVKVTRKGDDDDGDDDDGDDAN